MEKGKQPKREVRNVGSLFGYADDQADDQIVEVDQCNILGIEIIGDDIDAAATVSIVSEVPHPLLVDIELVDSSSTSSSATE
jgi:hypothetical protein